MRTYGIHHLGYAAVRNVDGTIFICQVCYKDVGYLVGIVSDFAALFLGPPNRSCFTSFRLFN